MTVKAFKELLSQYPENLRVVVNGYEDGYDDLAQERISVRKIELDTQIHGWEGQHSDFYGAEKETTGEGKIVEAVIFRRR